MATTLAELGKEPERLLNSEGFYNVLSYGWAYHDTEDPNYAGHTITTPPFKPDWDVLMNGGTIRYLPTETDEVLMSSGDDFIGMMTFARGRLAWESATWQVPVPPREKNSGTGTPPASSG